MNIQKLQKLQNASIACGPTALVLKKVRHGEAKTEAELAIVKFQKVQKVKKASIACRPTAPARKNMRGGAPNEIFLEISKAGRSETVLFR